MDPSDVIILKDDVKVAYVLFCMLVELKELDAFCLKLFKHWSGPIVKTEAYHIGNLSYLFCLSYDMRLPW